DSQTLRSFIAFQAPGSEVKLTVFRDGKNQDVTIKLGEQPENLRVAGRRGSSSEDVEVPEASGKTALGLKLSDVNDELAQRFGLDEKTRGALITDVENKSPAAKAGLKPGDVITEVGKKPVASASEAREALAKEDLKKGITL